MKRIRIFVVSMVFVLGMAGAANALPFAETHDYSGSGSYKGATYVELFASLLGSSFNDTFFFPVVSPPALDINSAYLEITHVGNLSTWFNPEIWILTANGGYNVGTLSPSGTPVSCSPWFTDHFDLSADVINAVTSGTPWQLALTLADTRPFIPDILWVDKATFGGDYQAVPEPATMLLLGIGLLGVAGIRRRMR